MSRTLADIPPLTRGVPFDEWWAKHNPPVLTPSKILAIWERSTGESALVCCRQGFVRNERFGRGGERVIPGTNRAKNRALRRAVGV